MYCCIVPCTFLRADGGLAQKDIDNEIIGMALTQFIYHLTNLTKCWFKFYSLTRFYSVSIKCLMFVNHTAVYYV